MFRVNRAQANRDRFADSQSGIHEKCDEGYVPHAGVGRPVRLLQEPDQLFGELPDRLRALLG